MKLTVHAAADEWLEHKQVHVRPRTYDDYVTRLHYILKDLGAKRLDNLRPLEVQHWIDHAEGVSGKTLGAKTIRQVIVVFRGMCQWFVDMDVLSKNPAAKVRLPPLSERAYTHLTMEQISQLLASTKGYKYEPAVQIAVYTGMRREEILGLSWRDVDFDTGLISIRQTLLRIRHGKQTGLILDKPKSNASHRQIPICQPLRKFLLEHKEKQQFRRIGADSAWEEHDLVVDNGLGAFVDPDNLSREFSQHMVKRAGLPHITFHTLRHHLAEALRAAGTDIKTISSLLGHSTTQITMNIYQHHSPELEKAAIDSLWKAG
jgi:integrase